MNTKRIFTSCLAAVVLATSVAMAAPRTMVRSSSARVTSSGTTFHHRHFRSSNQFVFFGSFGFPYYYSYYPYGYSYGYYPYGYYGYSPYDYSYGYNRYYNRPAYGYGYDASVVVQVQRRLAHAGYYHGAIDGITGPRTRAAIAAYERDHGMRVDGVISNRLLGTMGLRY